MEKSPDKGNAKEILNDRIRNLPSGIDFLVHPKNKKDWNKVKVRDYIYSKLKDVEAIYDELKKEDVEKLKNFFTVILSDIPDKPDESYSKKVYSEYYKIEDLT